MMYIFLYSVFVEGPISNLPNPLHPSSQWWFATSSAPHHSSWVSWSQCQEDRLCRPGKYFTSNSILYTSSLYAMLCTLSLYTKLYTRWSHCCCTHGTHINLFTGVAWESNLECKFQTVQQFEGETFQVSFLCFLLLEYFIMRHFYHLVYYL